MRVELRIERTVVEQADVELVLPDGVDWPDLLYKQMVLRPDGGEPPRADWELEDEGFDLVEVIDED